MNTHSEQRCSTSHPTACSLQTPQLPPSVSDVCPSIHRRLSTLTAVMHKQYPLQVLKESLRGRGKKDLITFTKCFLFTLIMAAATPCLCAHEVHASFSSCLFPYASHHKFTEAGNFSFSLSRADNELLASLLGFLRITGLSMKLNKITRVAQMSQCCLITNFPIKIKLGHLH